jgi:hypothetical protein
LQATNTIDSAFFGLSQEAASMKLRQIMIFQAEFEKSA